MTVEHNTPEVPAVRDWLLQLMGDYDFTVPTEAFNNLVEALSQAHRMRVTTIDQLQAMAEAQQGSGEPVARVQRINIAQRPHPVKGRGVLDGFVAYLDDEGNGQGRLTIAGWGRAWSAYWGAMGGSLRNFLSGADCHYIAGKLVPLGILKAKQEAHDDERVPLMVQMLLDELTVAPPSAQQVTGKREPDGWALLDKNGEAVDFHPRVREFFGAILNDHAPEFDSEWIAAQDRERSERAPHRCVEVFYGITGEQR